ncbi:MAG: glycosyltransferase family 4 protein [Alphaproteobacteria bacterium]|jgi:glycosyltransferase involved in cell wall biosynthesis
MAKPTKTDLPPASSPEPSIETPASETRAPVVLQVLPRLEAGGVERGAIDVAIALKKAGWGAVVVSAGGAMARELERHDIPHVILPVHSKNPMVMFRNIGRLQRVIKEYGANIIHARSRAPAWAAERAAKKAGIHFITTFHGTYGAKGVAKQLYNAVMTRGERVIAISEFIASHTQDHYRLGREYIRMIHRGVDVGLFNPENVTQERMIQLSTRWQLPDDRQVILMPGRFARWKGHELVIEALARLGRRDVLCVMVGVDTASKDYISTLESSAKAHGVEDLLRFVDYSRDLPAAYMLSDVVVSAASKPEAFGRVLAEALAMGRPVVGPAHGGALEIVNDKKTGWLYTPGNSEALAGALHAALSLNAGARHRLATEAMNTIRENFTNDRMCAQTLGVYSELLWDEDAPEGTVV